MHGQELFKRKENRMRIEGEAFLVNFLKLIGNFETQGGVL